jgi:3-methyladenine DNA glycosylase AlkD
MSSQILSTVKTHLKPHLDPVYEKTSHGFFKEPVRIRGVRTPIVRKIAQKVFKDREKDFFARQKAKPDQLVQSAKFFGTGQNLRVRQKFKKEIFALAEQLLKTDYQEDAIIAFDWVYRLREAFQPADLRLFEKWLNRYVNNWGKCDDFCCHTLGFSMTKYPAHLPVLKKWARSKNQWVRRAAAVTLILPARRGKYLKESFEIADLLLTDSEDLVQKGYGWLLKEASKARQKQVFDYVMKNKAKMPRVALRYALEKMPKNLKTRAMKQEG